MAQQVRYVVPVLGVKTYELHKGHAIRIPWHWVCNSDVPKLSPLRVTWDPAKTRVRASMHVRVHGSMPWLSANVSFNYFMNGRSVFWGRWSMLDNCVVREETRDVSLILINGENTFKAEACKDWWQASEPVMTVWATLTIEFEGEQPVVKPPPEPMEYVKWAFILAGVAVVGFLGVRILEAVRRK